ncbi:hypothetical protein FDP41_008146 [Naegleria fowleri]|uniref:SMP-30/Gluconolactonase/LRE-like region domain-containing protein n=1 Tax=Naegleria fowleri TaxID=5763 RepID=A0A6A5BF86_NAEFO|nr:uncharacterized protein FDP41_008146 [Naegleria fowleri]KAF0973442.1 hypothetical protein FDP41_008146 [Naegleria fowleri]CAG4717020.1 unnamed protein product [Naegleria fowleri]
MSLPSVVATTICVLEDRCHIDHTLDARVLREFKNKMKNGKRVKFSGKFKHVATISEDGAGKVLKHPNDVKISNQLSMIIISDFLNDRILCFQLFSFHYLFSIPLNRPGRMDLNRNDDLIIASNSMKVCKIDLRNRNEIWSVERAGLAICGISIEKKHSHRIFVCDASTRNPCIQIREQDGTFLSYFELSELYHPFAIAFDPIFNQAFISCYYEHVIVVRSLDHDTNTKELVGGYGEQVGQLRQPRGILWDGTQLIVCDCTNCRIQLFSLDGHVIKSFGSKGSHQVDQFWYPASVCLNELNGELFVVDNTNHRILVYQ